MKNFFLPIGGLILLLFGTVRAFSQSQEEKEAVNAIYHWKTTFDPTQEEWDFIKENQVKRMYVRYFDVDADPKPIATTIFKQNLPQDIEIVPTTFITVGACYWYEWIDAEARAEQCHALANKIVERLLKMSQVQQVTVKEVQFDCDWTSYNENDFFQLCAYARDTLHQLGIDLSVTIRLHQLGVLKNVPADRGVLMLYNTSNLKDYSVKNSILSYNVVKQYLARVPEKHTLDLDFAYPIYSWGIWYDEDKDFKGILRKVDISDKKLYKPIGDNCYEVLKDHQIDSRKVLAGHFIRWENSEYNEVMKVKNAVEAYPTLKGDRYSVILYHLDINNISKFSQNEIENIYRH